MSQIQKIQIAADVQNEYALINAIQSKAQFTVIGFIEGELHVPSKGWIL